MALPTPTPTLAKEVFLRVRQKMTVEQCTYFLNGALGIVTAAGNFPWDQVQSLATAIPGGVYRPVAANIDLGKKVSCFNTSNQLPIVRVRQDEIGIAATGYLNVSTTNWSVFRIGMDPGPARPFFQFYPLTATDTVDIYYHIVPPVLTNTATSSPLWINTWMDTLLCDFAEMEIKRILGAPDAASLEERCQARLKSAVEMFSTERENTGPPSDVVNAVAEKTQLGRA